MPEEGVDLTPSQELLTTAEIMRLVSKHTRLVLGACVISYFLSRVGT
jgi:hypothetical protein